MAVGGVLSFCSLLLATLYSGNLSFVAASTSNFVIGIYEETCIKTKRGSTASPNNLLSAVDFDSYFITYSVTVAYSSIFTGFVCKISGVFETIFGESCGLHCVSLESMIGHTFMP